MDNNLVHPNYAKKTRRTKETLPALISTDSHTNAGPDPKITTEEQQFRLKEDDRLRTYWTLRIGWWVSLMMVLILDAGLHLGFWIGVLLAIPLFVFGRITRRYKINRNQIATARQRRDPKWIAEQARLAAEEKARRDAHMRDFFRQWTADIDRYSQYGDSAVNQAMINSLNAFFPVPAGQMHDYQVIWDTNDREPDGTIKFEFLRHNVVFTPAEIQRRQLAEQTQQINVAAMWNSVFTEWTIRRQGDRIVDAINHRR